MRIYLAGTSAFDVPLEESKYTLESFYYFQEWQKKYINKDFMLDSGAFTFMSNQKQTQNIDFDEYVERYAKFINENNIELFFELDIDCVVGINEVERLRNKLEKLTNKRCIPVWHKSRGFDYYKRLVQEYDYIAIGGIVTKEIKKDEFVIFSELIRIAHDNKCKVHALGFLGYLKERVYNFDSVDGTNWNLGTRLGVLFNLVGKTMYRREFKNKRIKDPKKLTIHNFNEWCKYQKEKD